MNEAAFARLEASSQALIDALDSRSVDRLEAAVAEYRAAFEGVRDQIDDADKERLRARLTHMLRLADAAQMRVNFLTDGNTRRLHAVQAARGAPVPATYARTR